MTCDGSGERRWGWTCPGCDACEGRTTPLMRYTPALNGGTANPRINPCPWCLTEHKGDCPPDAIERAWAPIREGLAR